MSSCELPQEDVAAFLAQQKGADHKDKIQNCLVAMQDDYSYVNPHPAPIADLLAH